MEYELGFIGAGNMAEAIVRGVLRAGLLGTERIIAADPSPARRTLFEQELGVRSAESNARAADAATIILAVKPQQMQSVLAGLAPSLSPSTLVVSIAAGISTGFIAQSLGRGLPWRVIRAMPNTPMLVGAGMVALCRGKDAGGADLAAAQRIFESSAKVIEVEEAAMDAVTAVSGSGPAYLFYLVEQMIRAGLELGLSVEQAAMLARTTAVGAAKMLETSTEAPAELRRKVTSPGGTTAAAIEVMESCGVPQAIVDAIKRAARRSAELGK